MRPHTPETGTKTPASGTAPGPADEAAALPLLTADRILTAIRTHTDADNPSAFLALNEEAEHFTSARADGVVVFRRCGGYAVQFGGPFAPRRDYRTLLHEFVRFADRSGLAPVAVQLQRHDAEIYADSGFTVNQIGASYAVGLAAFTLRGTRFMQLRNKIARARRAGLAVAETDAAACRAALREIDAAWLASKGAHARPLEFLVGRTGGRGQPYRRLFLGAIDGRPIGYISYSPVAGSRPGWMHDLSRRVPDGPPGVMEAVNSAAIDTFRAEGVRWLHFGFTPFTGLREEHEVPGHSQGLRWFLRHLEEHGEAVYPARTQLAYKRKWAPDVLLPEYAAFRGGASLAAFAHIFRAANAF
ncbi:DUF2156 domain-containing protein [Streptomyces sp. NPDC050617]|uniref:DUF2156 domain-containing protein n=1 Tax=Streptomyces sp. NPDC050617 TaxID=3154628 RepID=UPI003442269D